MSTDRKALRWSQLTKMSDQQIREAFPDPDCDVIFAVSYNEVYHLKEFGDRFISTARINRCDLLVVSADDKPPFPNAGPFLEKTVPWHLDEVFKLLRAVVTMGGPELFCFVATSSASGKQNRLATTVQKKRSCWPRDLVLFTWNSQSPLRMNPTLRYLPRIKPSQAYLMGWGERAPNAYQTHTEITAAHASFGTNSSPMTSRAC